MQRAAAAQSLPVNQPATQVRGAFSRTVCIPLSGRSGMMCRKSRLKQSRSGWFSGFHTGDGLLSHSLASLTSLAETSEPLNKQTARKTKTLLFEIVPITVRKCIKFGATAALFMRPCFKMRANGTIR